ncbi:zinc-ribbon domain-containing protein [Agromyces sp. NPDC057679]|uniref:zinc-ribbon domain-containing protein n=1 Tax=Agromyces sp. NPDC057679 TaxID=3346207 RepID=UPI00366D0B35
MPGAWRRPSAAKSSEKQPNSAVSAHVVSVKTTTARKPSLAEVNPALAAEWHEQLNAPLLASDLLPMSGVKVWWRCAKGHAWIAKVSRRSQGSGCPVCAGKQVSPGVNDLATRFPAVAAEWHHELNGGLTAQDVFATSKKSAWWQCGHGHEWDAVIAERTLGGVGCQVCAGRRPIAGVDDLATTHPALAAEWGVQRAGASGPDQVFATSRAYVNWRCAEGHEWRAVILSRVLGAGCQVCSGRKPETGFNDLATSHPAVAAEWAADRNGTRTPETTKQSSKYLAWWRCADGHAWQQQVRERTRWQSTGCETCARGIETPAPVLALPTARPRVHAIVVDRRRRVIPADRLTAWVQAASEDPFSDEALALSPRFAMIVTGTAAPRRTADGWALPDQLNPADIIVRHDLEWKPAAEIWARHQEVTAAAAQQNAAAATDSTAAAA